MESNSQEMMPDVQNTLKYSRCNRSLFCDDEGVGEMEIPGCGIDAVRTFIHASVVDLMREG